MKVFDLHCDTLSELRYAEEAGQPKSFAENDLQIDLKKLQKGDYMLQCFAAFVNLARPGQDPLVAALEEIDIFKRIMAKYSDFIAPVYQPEDLRKNAEAGKISGMLTIEEGGCCKGSLGVLRLMHELGVRMMTLTWNHENELASPNVVPGADADTIWPCQPNTKTGLKEKGFEFLAEMERLHIIADVSHLSDKGFWDIAEHSTRPFAASHSNCRALAPHCRNLTDEMIRAKEMIPMQKAPKISVLPAAGVMATSPATAPVQAPTVVGFLFTIQSMSIQVVAAAAVAIWVTRKALAARPSAARPLPALKPNHPNQRNDIPMNTKVML